MFKQFFWFMTVIFFLNACANTVPTTISPPGQITATHTVFPSQITRIETTNSTPSVMLNTTETAWSNTQEAFRSAYPGICDTELRSNLLSPDQNWLAQDCPYNALQVIRHDGSAIWKVPYKEIFGELDPAGISPRHWSADSQYLYFTAAYCCWDPFVLMLAETTSLYRMDMKDGRYNLIRKGVFDFSFSPTNRRVTFIEELSSPPVVEILDLQSGTIKNVTLGVDNTYNQAKVDIWSEDGKKFVVKTVSGINYSHDAFNNDMYSVILIDVDDLSQNIIVKDMPTTILEVTEWTQDGILRFRTGDETFGPIVFWQYDLNTKALVTSTPGP